MFEIDGEEKKSPLALWLHNFYRAHAGEWDDMMIVTFVTKAMLQATCQVYSAVMFDPAELQRHEQETLRATELAPVADGREMNTFYQQHMIRARLEAGSGLILQESHLMRELFNDIKEVMSVRVYLKKSSTYLFSEKFRSGSLDKKL